METTNSQKLHFVHTILEFYTLEFNIKDLCHSPVTGVFCLFFLLVFDSFSHLSVFGKVKPFFFFI